MNAELAHKRRATMLTDFWGFILKYYKHSRTKMVERSRIEIRMDIMGHRKYLPTSRKPNKKREQKLSF